MVILNRMVEIYKFEHISTFHLILLIIIIIIKKYGMWKCVRKCVMIYTWLRFERLFEQMLFVSIKRLIVYTQDIYILNELMSTKIMFICIFFLVSFHSLKSTTLSSKIPLTIYKFACIPDVILSIGLVW